MAVSINKLKPGDCVYYVYKRKMGNTTMTSVAINTYCITEVDLENGLVKVFINGRVETKGASFLKVVRKSRPETEVTMMGKTVIKRKVKHVKPDSN